MNGLPISLEEITTPFHVDATKVQQQMELSLRGEFLVRSIELNAAGDGQIERRKKGGF